MSSSISKRISSWVFGQRTVLLSGFFVITLGMLVAASSLRPDAGFEKSIPLTHPYMQTFLEYQAEFGGANRILVALSVDEGDIFTPAFFEKLQAVTDEIFFIPGVDRAQVRSLFTPNVRFVEILEDGFAGGNVVPADFSPTPEFLETVRVNTLKAGEVGRLVANDFTAAIISAQLLERDPDTGERIDYLAIAQQLEDIRTRYESDGVRVHIIGFAKLIGDVASGAAGVVAFFGITLLITAGLVWLYSRSWLLTLLPLMCSLVAVCWQLGLLTLLGMGLDPMSILVPFLVFAIGVSHGVQMINATRAELAAGSSADKAARSAFERLLLPGAVALVSDTVGFLTLLLIDIGIIRELAIAASLGVAVIVFTNLLLLPLLISCLRVSPKAFARSASAPDTVSGLWSSLSGLARRPVAASVLGVVVLIGGVGLWQAQGLQIGDLRVGAPQLRDAARYNQDSQLITDRFSIGVDSISIIAEASPNACIDFGPMRAIDEFEWRMRNTDGVQSTISLANVARVVNAGWNEGNVKWRVIPRNSQVLAQSVSGVETASGLLNTDCSVMPVTLFTRDHKATTIAHIIEEAKRTAADLDTEGVQFRLASGNVGVMAATNEAVQEAQIPMLFYVYAAVIGLCLIFFRSWRGTLYIVLPLGIVSALAYAVMAQLSIGLTVYTLPVVALGVGVGVDYGIYIFARLQEHLRAGIGLERAYRRALSETGAAVIFTGLSLAIAVSTWILSALQFQADMGILLTFMFLMNMAGAILLIPALAAWLEPGDAVGPNLSVVPAEAASESGLHEPSIAPERSAQG